MIFGPVVQKEMLFKEKFTDDRWTVDKDTITKLEDLTVLKRSPDLLIMLKKVKINYSL